MNCASIFCRVRIAHQKNAKSAGGTTSNNQSKFGFSKRIFVSSLRR
jgi:hypothetical protein